MALDGLTVEGMALDGLTIDSLTIKGLTVEGLTVYGLTVDSLVLINEMSNTDVDDPYLFRNVYSNRENNIRALTLITQRSTSASITLAL